MTAPSQLREGEMDREQEIINAVSETLKIISGMQTTISSINECIALLKVRVEELDARS